MRVGLPHYLLFNWPKTNWSETLIMKKRPFTITSNKESDILSYSQENMIYLETEYLFEFLLEIALNI